MVYLFATQGFDGVIKKHYSEFIGTIMLIAILISSYVMPFIGSKLLSQKVFDLLYNKIDIYLFKKAVGYK